MARGYAFVTECVTRDSVSSKSRKLRIPDLVFCAGEKFKGDEFKNRYGSCATHLSAAGEGECGTYTSSLPCMAGPIFINKYFSNTKISPPPYTKPIRIFDMATSGGLGWDWVPKTRIKGD